MQKELTSLNKVAQNNWGGCLLFTWVNLISFVGG